MSAKHTNSEIEKLKEALPPNYLEFVRHYIDGHTPLACLELAGMASGSEPDDEEMARTVLQAPKVKAYINALKQCAADKSVMSLAEADKYLTELALTDVMDVVEVSEYQKKEADEDGNLIETGEIGTSITIKDASLLTKAQKAAIVSIKTTNGGIEIKLADKMKALDMLIRRKAGYTDVIKSESENVHVFAMIGDNGRGPKD